jgi:tripeptide aminopeptidase
MTKLFLVLFAGLTSAFAQDPAALMADASVKAAFEAAKRNEPHFLDEQARICEIPAPPFKEEVRGKELARLFEKAGLKDVASIKPGT